MISLNSPKTLIGMMSTFSDVSPACSVELKSPESAENGALGVDNPRGVLPMSGRLKTMMRCAPALRSRAICASVSVAAVVILACTWAAVSKPEPAAETLTRMSLAPIQTVYTALGLSVGVACSNSSICTESERCGAPVGIKGDGWVTRAPPCAKSTPPCVTGVTVMP